MNSYFRLLRLLVILGGCTLTSAAGAVFFSPELMVSVHRSLGMGDFPVQPITVYLAKSAAMLYAVHGAVLLFVAINFNQYKHLVPFLGWLHVAMGAGLIYIDTASGMPSWWLASEGPPVIALGLIFVWLYRKAMRKQSPV